MSCTQVDKILKVVPRERVTYLYSATMTRKVQKLQRASLHNPVKIEVSTKQVELSDSLVHILTSVVIHYRYQTVEKLQQSYIFIPSKYKVMCNAREIYDIIGAVPLKDCYLVAILNDLAGNSFMVFCGTCNNTQRWA